MTELKRWLDGNLKTKVANEARSAWGSSDLAQFRTELVGKALWRYADYLHKYLRAKEHGDELRAGRLDERRKGMAILLAELDLSREKAELEYLFEQAALLSPNALRTD